MANYKIGVEFEADGSKAVSAINQVAQAMQNLQNQVGSNTRQIQSSFQNLSVSFGSIFKVLGTTFAVNNIAGFIKDTVDATAQLQQTKISFEVFTGSAETAKNMLSELKDIAIKSPMQFQDITKGTQTLLGYGLTAEQVIPIVKMLGDISGGNTDKFNRLALAFGQVNGAGRLMGQETRQMINAGFNPLQAIADKTGKTMSELTKEMHDGKISVQDVADAFTYATSEGGRFYGMAEKQSQTLGGALNKLSESFFFIKSDLGDFLTGIFDIQGGVQGLVNYLTNLMAPLKDLVQTFSLSKNVMGILSFAFDTLKGSFVIGIKVFESLLSVIDSILGGIKTVFQWLADKIPALGNIFKGLFNDTIGRVTKLGQEYSKAQKATTTKKEEKKEVKFSTKPSSASSDEMTKAEKNKLDKLIEQSKSGYTELTNLFRSYTKSKLEIFDEEAKKELDNLKKYHLNTYKVEQSQYKLRQDLASLELFKLSSIVNKNISVEGLKKSLRNMVDVADKGFAELRGVIDRSIANNPLNGMEAFMEKFASLDTAFTYIVNKITSNDKVSRITEYANSIKSALTDFSVGIYSGFGEIIGGLVGGMMSFQDVINQIGNMFLNLMGDLLIQIGTSAIKMGISADAIREALLAIGIAGGAPAIIAGGLAVAAGYALKGLSQKAKSTSEGSASALSGKTTGNTSGMKSGASYQYGGASYSTQSIRLAIDLTGAITASPTGYNINKSLETVLRVTGR
jgi:tape measure domain-containing protein